MNDVGGNNTGGSYIWPLGWVPPLPDTPENRVINMWFAEMHVEDQQRRARVQTQRQPRQSQPLDLGELKQWGWALLILLVLSLLFMLTGNV